MMLDSAVLDATIAALEPFRDAAERGSYIRHELNVVLDRLRVLASWADQGCQCREQSRDCPFHNQWVLK